MDFRLIVDLAFQVLDCASITINLHRDWILVVNLDEDISFFFRGNWQWDRGLVS